MSVIHGMSKGSTTEDMEWPLIRHFTKLPLCSLMLGAGAWGTSVS